MIPITSPSIPLTFDPSSALFNSNGIIAPTELSCAITSLAGTGQPL